MIAVDTNVLVHAHREDSEWHEKAHAAMQGLAESRASWALPWPCIHEFFAIVTHPRIWRPPSPRKRAVDQIEAWLESPSLVLLAEGSRHWEELRRQLERGRVAGPQVHDARIVALSLAHGVRTLWTADRDFSRYAGLATSNPLTAGWAGSVVK